MNSSISNWFFFISSVRFFCKGQLSLQLGKAAGCDHLAQVFVLLVKLTALCHQPLPCGGVGSELPSCQLVSGLLCLLLQGVALLGQLLDYQVDRWVDQSVPQGCCAGSLGG